MFVGLESCLIQTISLSMAVSNTDSYKDFDYLRQCIAFSFPKRVERTTQRTITAILHDILHFAK